MDLTSIIIISEHLTGYKNKHRRPINILTKNNIALHVSSMIFINHTKNSVVPYFIFARETFESLVL